MPLHRRSLLVALATIGMLFACSPDPPLPTLEPVTPLSSGERDAIVQRLNETLTANSLARLQPNEPRVICSNYEEANWDLDQVLDPLLEEGRDNAKAWRDYHNHFTLVVIVQNHSGLSFEEKVAQTIPLLRAFCESL